MAKQKHCPHPPPPPLSYVICVPSTYQKAIERDLTHEKPIYLMFSLSGNRQIGSGPLLW